MQKKKSKKQLAWLLAATMVLSGLPAQQTQAAKATKLSSKKITITVGKSKTLKLKNNKKKTTWKIMSGKKCIKLKNKKKNIVKIVALKTGKAKVQVKAGKKKYTCTVTVKAAKQQNTKTTSKAPSAGNTAKATQTPSVTGNPLSTKTPNTTKEPNATGIPSTTNKPNPTTPDDSVEKKAADVAALQSIIQEQRQKGATVSEDLDSEQYTWENGRLVEIYWGECGLSGELSFAALTALQSLYCYDTDISYLDISKNTSLEILNCGETKISSLDVSKNTALTDLFCYGTNLSSLDVSHNIVLEVLECEYTQIESLDVSGATALTELFCYNTNISILDVSNNKVLTLLWCYNTNISTLDIRNNKELDDLDCDENVVVIRTESDIEKNALDVAALQSIIQEQRQQGATVSEDLDSNQYTWKNGRLVKIAWTWKALQGDLDVSGLTELEGLKRFSHSRFISE